MESRTEIKSKPEPVFQGEVPASSDRSPSPLKESTGVGEFLTIKNLAIIFKVSIYTIRAWRRLGKLPRAYKFGKLIRWKREDIETWAKVKKEPVEILNIRALEWSRQALQKRSAS